MYMGASVAGGWAGAVMSWAGAVMSWAGAVMVWVGAVTVWTGALKAVCILKVKAGLTHRPTDRQKQ